MSMFPYGHSTMMYPTSQLEGQLGTTPSPDHLTTTLGVYDYRPFPGPGPSQASFYPRGWYGSLYGHSYQNDCVYDSLLPSNHTVGSYSPPSGFNMVPYASRENTGAYPTGTDKKNSSLMSCNSSPSSSHSPGSSAAGSPPGFQVSQAFSWMNDVNSAVQSASRKERTRTKDKYRVVYTEKQKVGLEKAYKKNKFITAAIRLELSKSCGLSERQIKIWFQNRRAKERKLGRRQEEKDALTVESSLTTNTDIVQSTPYISKSSCAQSPEQLPVPPQMSSPECLYESEAYENSVAYRSTLDQYSPLHTMGSYPSSQSVSQLQGHHQQSLVISSGTDVITSMQSGVSNFSLAPVV